MFVIIEDGHNFGYKYSCRKCRTVYFATHDEEKRTHAGHAYTVCPVCNAPVVWADTTKEVHCSDFINGTKK